MTKAVRNKVFVSYSHKDKKLFEEFKTMLAPAIRNGAVDIWDDKRIDIGAKWKQEIEMALASAKVAVLLVSQNFLASDFIARQELPPLLNAAQSSGVSIFWICLSSCLYEQTEIAAYQSAHDPTKPLDRLDRPQRQAVLSQVCAKLVRLARNDTIESKPMAKRGKSVSTASAKPLVKTVHQIYQRGLRHLSDGDYDAALTALNDTIDLDPTIAVAFYNRGLTHNYLRDEALAIADFDQALELGLNDAILFRNRGNAHSRLGNVELALSDYAQAIALEPENSLAYLNRGEVLENTSQKAKAIADYQKVLALVAEPDIHDIARTRLRAMGVRPTGRKRS
jgi:tetratricopeptide (TPR) repeat protein